MENPYQDSSPSSPDFVNAKEKILQEAAEIAKKDPEIKKEIDKANIEQEEMIQKEFDKQFDKRVVYNIFIVVFITNILINIDHGALPGCYD